MKEVRDLYDPLIILERCTMSHLTMYISYFHVAFPSCKTLRHLWKSLSVITQIPEDMIPTKQGKG